jgi:cytochrome b561
VFAQRIHWPTGCNVAALMLLRAWLGAWKHHIDGGRRCVFAQRIHWPTGCNVAALMLLRAWLGAWKHRIDEGLHVYVCTQVSMLWLNRTRVGFIFFFAVF